MRYASWWIVVLSLLAWAVLVGLMALVGCTVSARLEYQTGPARAASAASGGE